MFANISLYNAGYIALQRQQFMMFGPARLHFLNLFSSAPILSWAAYRYSADALQNQPKGYLEVVETYGDKYST
jgi:hypothetical protein